MNSQIDFANSIYESLKSAILHLLSGKVCVHACPESVKYFNRSLLTPAEFLNSVEIHPISFNINLRDESFFQQSSVINFKFVDLEEYDNFSKKYFRANLISTISDNAPSDELLEQLEKVYSEGIIRE